MNVLIISSSSDNIDPYYLSIARSISSYLASNECNLVFGGSSHSMMGICYEEFTSKGREVQAFTTRKYANDLINLQYAKHYIKETTFDLKKSMFQNSDIIVALPGGTGTISELYSYIEENRSNNQIMPIILYNEGNFYKPFLNQLEILKENGFNDDSINNYFKVANNKDEFQQAVESYLWKEGKKSHGK